MNNTSYRLSPEGIKHAIEYEYNKDKWTPTKRYFVSNLDMSDSEDGLISFKFDDVYFWAKLTPRGQYKKNSLRIDRDRI